MVVIDGHPLGGFEALYDHQNIKLVLEDGKVEFAADDLGKHYTLRKPQPENRPSYGDE